ncbi:MAG: HEAT repeat domain-containing protein [Planctomycetes bacterium]|jgi:hypothetical protein|nr:HEAT repeat domain-containing protein [Planctomycetota bacterium]
MRIRPFLPSLLLGLTAAVAAGAGDDPVTRMGKTLLPRSDLVVRGAAVRSSRLGAGVTVVRFAVADPLHGRPAGDTVTILADNPEVCPAPGLSCVLFLARLSGDRYRIVERMDLAGVDGAAKLKTLRAYLAIEEMTDPVEKRRALRALLLENLISGDNFLVYSSARELAHFTEENAGLFTPEDAAILAGKRQTARDPLLTDLLTTSLERLPPPPGAEETAPPIPRALRSPEFERLAAAFEKGIEDVEERRSALAALCARHLRHAGPILLAALSDPDPVVREMAAREAGEAGLAEAVKPLIALLGREKDREVLRGVIQGLGLLRSEEAFASISAFAADAGLVRAVATAAMRIGTTGAVDFVRGLRASRGEKEPELADFLDFLLSERFVEQEAVLARVRAGRLR